MAESFVACKKFDAQDMAKRFTEEFFRQPKRGYGSNVVDVFYALKESEYEDPFGPAKNQFNGTGSYGNGAAMRVAPVALFGVHLPEEQLVSLARDTAFVTHAHRNGYNGAILQCLAIRRALEMGSQPGFTFDPKTFLNQLIVSMEKIENETPSESPKQQPKTEMPHERRSAVLSNKNREALESKTPFTDKLKVIKTLTEDRTQGSDLSSEEVAVILGNDVSALKSVPTAIYSVIRAHKPLEYYETDNIFLRTLYLAISVGGDTDTIATMAGSIVGALYGTDIIPPVYERHCEEYQVMINLAKELETVVAQP
jgi:poly(ADP-ribose) glycohydrolase ARH3